MAAANDYKAEYGQKMRQLADDMLKIQYRANKLWQEYFDNLSAEVGAMEGGAYDADMLMSKETIIGMVTVMEQYDKLMDGQATATSAYRASCNMAISKQ